MVVGCGSSRVIRGVDSGGIGELVGMRVDSCGGDGGVGRGVGCGSGRVIRGVDCGGIGEVAVMSVDRCGGSGGVGRGLVVEVVGLLGGLIVGALVNWLA